MVLLTPAKPSAKPRQPTYVVSTVVYIALVPKSCTLPQVPRHTKSLAHAQETIYIGEVVTVYFFPEVLTTWALVTSNSTEIPRRCGSSPSFGTTHGRRHFFLTTLRKL